MKARFRALVRWLESGNWHSLDVDHCCAACEATKRRIRELAGYGRERHAYFTQPVREALPIKPIQRELEIAALEEWKRR